jgi:hypothetical protein
MKPSEILLPISKSSWFLVSRSSSLFSEMEESALEEGFGTITKIYRRGKTRPCDQGLAFERNPRED